MLLRFLARRLLFAALLVLFVSSAAILLTRLAPGDLTADLAFRAPPEEVARVRARFGLDRGLGEQWALWVARAARFDFGDSYLYNRRVGELVAAASANSAALAVVALALATFAGIPLGVLSGSRSGWLPASVRAVSVLCLSVPPLLTSLAFVWLAARTGWFPVGGMSSAGATALGWGAWLADLAWHLPLPALALALPVAASLERLQAQSIAEAVRQPFVNAARARGLSAAEAVRRHAWRASLRPVCALYGVVIGALLSGSFAVEYVTSWPGLGRLMFDALRARDVYLVAGCAAAGALFLALGSLVSDLLLAAADPRVREGGPT